MLEVKIFLNDRVDFSKLVPFDQERDESPYCLRPGLPDETNIHLPGQLDYKSALRCFGMILLVVVGQCRIGHA